MRATMQSSRLSRVCGSRAGALCSSLRRSRVPCTFLEPADPLPACIRAQEECVGCIPHIPNCGHWRKLRHVPGHDGAGRARGTALCGRGAVRSPAFFSACIYRSGVHRRSQLASHGNTTFPAKCCITSPLWGALLTCQLLASPGKLCMPQRHKNNHSAASQHMPYHRFVTHIHRSLLHCAYPEFCMPCSCVSVSDSTGIHILPRARPGSCLCWTARRGCRRRRRGWTRSCARAALPTCRPTRRTA